MESNGEPGRIQVSAATADYLIEAGKGAWLTEREGGVEAKGKGTMRTFWVEPQLDRATTVSMYSTADSAEESADLEANGNSYDISL
jgi:class 3 adenylate cyclase